MRADATRIRRSGAGARGSGTSVVGNRQSDAAYVDALHDLGASWATRARERLCVDGMSHVLVPSAQPHDALGPARVRALGESAVAESACVGNVASASRIADRKGDDVVSRRKAPVLAERDRYAEEPKGLSLRMARSCELAELPRCDGVESRSLSACEMGRAFDVDAPCGEVVARSHEAGKSEPRIAGLEASEECIDAQQCLPCRAGVALARTSRRRRADRRRSETQRHEGKPGAGATSRHAPTTPRGGQRFPVRVE